MEVFRPFFGYDESIWCLAKTQNDKCKRERENYGKKMVERKYRISDLSEKF